MYWRRASPFPGWLLRIQVFSCHSPRCFSRGLQFINAGHRKQYSKQFMLAISNLGSSWAAGLLCVCLFYGSLGPKEHSDSRLWHDGIAACQTLSLQSSPSFWLGTIQYWQQYDLQVCWCSQDSQVVEECRTFLISELDVPARRDQHGLFPSSSCDAHFDVSAGYTLFWQLFWRVWKTSQHCFYSSMA